MSNKIITRGGANSLLERRFLLLKKEEVDDMFELVDTIKAQNTYSKVRISFTAQDNSYYLLIPTDNYCNIVIAINIINGKYAFMSTSINTENGGIFDGGYTMSNNTVNFTTNVLAENVINTISFNVYKMK